MRTIHMALAVMLAAAMARAAEGPDQQQAETGGVKTAPVAAKIEYSLDGGATYSAALPATVEPGQIKLQARVTFNVDDAAAVAMLFLAFEDQSTRSAFCLGSLQDARGKYCGALPLWTHVAGTLNGKAITGPLHPMMYHYLPIDSAALVRGPNTLIVTGGLAAAGYSRGVPTKALALLAAGPQKPAIRSGPTLGMIGEDFFTVTCRTSLPAAVTVTATPLEPAGAASTETSAPALYHRLKVMLPKGTRKFKYTIAGKAGAFEDAKGPFEVTLPDPQNFRFLAVGNTRNSSNNITLCPALIAQMLKTRPQLFMHAGQVVELGTWDFHWDPYYFTPYAQVLATVPTYLAPDGGDHTGMVYKTFWTPAGDSEVLNWTQVIGNARFIGLDGAQDWAAGSPNAAWLEGVLKNSREKFVFVFNHFPGYASGMMGKMKLPPLVQCREVILPLLAKYNATALISAFDYDYERCEATPPKGVTCIIVGAGGSKRLNQSPTATRNNPFAGTGPFVYEHSFAVFDVKADACVMTAIDIAGKEIDSKTFKPRPR
ncbi:MAG: hypothetical protein ABFD92_17680 [Planctomycetaceae bacterium]|nr:hypothetical protein [Planctomycetaceae bacterium]